MKTLYDELKSCDEIRIHTKFGAFQQEDYTDEAAQHFSEAKAVCYRNARDRIIKRYAEKSGLIAGVLKGRRSFYDLGQPIIERVNELEMKIANGEIRRVKKRDIIGRDGRAIEDVAETVDCLRENGIIDAGKFFNPVGYCYEKAGGLICNHAGKIVLLSTAAAASLFYSFTSEAPDRERYILTALGGFVGLMWSGLPLIGIKDNIQTRLQNTLSKQKENFESALNYLDKNVKSARETLR